MSEREMESGEESKETFSERLQELNDLFLKDEISPDEYKVLKNKLKDKFSEKEEDEEAEEDKKPKAAKKLKKADNHENQIASADSAENRIGWMVLAGLVIAVILYSIMTASGAGSSFTGFSVSQNTGQANGNAQLVKLYVEGSKYIMVPATLKVGTPVRIEADLSRMPGCSKSVVISGLGIRTSLSEGNNIIEFTPTKAGTFNIACSMNMYKGTFTVLQADGSKTNYVEPAPVGGHTCGGGSGGGCGGGCGA